MDKYIYDESNGLWYELQGDYYIHCLILSEEETQPIRLWGQRHKEYLKEHKHLVYTTMLMEGKLNSYLADIDRQAQEPLNAHRTDETGTGSYRAAKSGKCFRCLGRMNSIRTCVREIVEREIIFT
ncbi:TnpV protein [Hominenteromicrobium sp.]|uniref:TnpV protein n=1 Tax=Hominenteromicrobium sp. TaxID=3073581 RepID=UPI003A928353